jgi:hypothetical protein
MLRHAKTACKQMKCQDHDCQAHAVPANGPSNGPADFQFLLALGDAATLVLYVDEAGLLTFM